MCPSTATVQGGLCFGRLAEQSPLTDVEPKSLTEVSSEHTPINLPSRKGSLDTNLDDLATTLDASEVYDTTDVGRLTSPLFSQEREVSANPFSFSCSQTRSSVEKSMRDVEPFSSYGKPLLKGRRNRELESVQDAQMERERILSKRRDIHDFLEKKADHAFQGECAAQTRLSEALSELDRREWRMRNADFAHHETGMQLQSHKMELYQANQLTDQTRSEESWLCDELEMRNRAFQEDHERNCQEIEELRRICCTEAERARSTRQGEFLEWCNIVSTLREFHEFGIVLYEIEAH